MTDWRPAATIATLRRRAQLLAAIRAFFAARDVWEVDAPVLGQTAPSEPQIDPMLVRAGAATLYLQSSPEYFLKRLLAAGSGAIYSLGKGFRAGERGARHHPEFTLLEWYRPGFDEWQLMEELAALVRAVAPELAPGGSCRIGYRAAFLDAVGIDPDQGDLDRLRAAAAAASGGDWRGEDRVTCLELLFSLRVEPQLPAGLVFITGYPVCQAALAQLARDAEGRVVARRFEAFLDGVELANGYFELTDATEQRERFGADNARRAALGKPAVAADERLLAALAAGLPEGAGVALGVDRLLMRILRLPQIDAVLPFTLPR